MILIFYKTFLGLLKMIFISLSFNFFWWLVCQ